MVRKNRGNGIMALVLVVCLVWAYWVSHPGADDTGTSGKQSPIWRLQPEQVRQLTYQDGDFRVELTPDWSTPGKLPFIWIVEQSPETPSPEASANPKSPEAPQQTPGTRRVAFKGNRLALRALRFFAAPRALRMVGPLDRLQGETFGFPASGRWVALARGEGGEPLRLEMGRKTYGGASRYVLSDRDNRVYLVSNAELSLLARARTRLMDRRVMGLDPAHIDRIELRMGGRTRSFVRVAHSGQWTADGEPAREDLPVRAFLQSLTRLSVNGYVPGQAVPEQTPLLELRLFRSGESQPADDLRLFEESGEGGTSGILAVSRYTVKPVNLKRGVVDPLLREGRKLLPGS